MKNPKQLSRLIEVYLGAGLFKSALKGMCEEAVTFSMTAKSQNSLVFSAVVFRYYDEMLHLEITRDSIKSNNFYLKLGRTTDYVILDSLYIGNLTNAGDIYNKIIESLDKDVELEQQMLSKLDNDKTSEAIYQQVSGFRG